MFQTRTKGKILFCGGVSKNKAVLNHLEKLIQQDLTIDLHSPAYGAIGAAVSLYDEINDSTEYDPNPLKNNKRILFVSSKKQAIAKYPELTLSLSEYPDFTVYAAYDFEGIEVEIYENPNHISTKKAYLGVDVGSTSTKSILINQAGIPIVGLYTKNRITAGSSRSKNYLKPILIFLNHTILTLIFQGAAPQAPAGESAERLSVLILNRMKLRPMPLRLVS